jgi:hypothetical protein
MAALAVEQEVHESQEGYIGADFDRGLSRLVDRTVAEIAEDRSLDPLGALAGVVGIMRHRPELVRRLGRETDSRLERHRERSRQRYHSQKAQRDAEPAKELERAEFEELMVAA